MKYKSFLGNHILLMGIITIAVLIRTWRYTTFPPSWDPAVYIQMGKYLYSNGHLGLIEPYRPLTWPLLLGAIFKLGFSPILCGKILEFLFSIGSIVLVYLIGLKVFDQTTGLIAALFFSFSPTHFYFGNTLYADIPAAFFGLLSVLLFIEGKYFLSGILISLTFFTKFIYFIPLAIMTGFSFSAASTNTSIKSNPPLIIFIKGIMLPTIFFLSLNFRLYHNVFQPFLDANKIYSQIYFNWSHGITLCVRKLFTTERSVFIFTPLMILALIQHKVSRLKVMIFAIGIGLFLWIGKWPMGISRFLTACVPYLYLSSVYGFLTAYRSSLKLYIKGFLLCLLVYCLGWQIHQVDKIDFPENELSIFQKYVITHSPAIKDGLWISDPSMTVFSNLKIQELMYYPVFNTPKIIELTNNLPKANYIFYDGSLLICRPTNDKICAEAKEKLLKRIMNNFELVWPDNISLFTDFGIFKRPSNFRL